MMQKVYLLIREMKAGIFTSVLICVAIIISVFSVVVFESVNRSVEIYMNEKFSQNIPPDIIKITPVQESSFLPSLFGRTSRSLISKKNVRKIKKMKGIKEVYPLIGGDFPLHARIQFLGFNYGTDISCVGITYSYIKEDVAPRYRRQWKRKRGEIIPVLIPRLMVRAYNEGMAQPNNLPVLSEKQLVGFKINITPGVSSVRSASNPEQVRAVIAGITDRVGGFTLVMPVHYIKHYNKHFTGSSIPGGYRGLYIKTESHDAFMDVFSSLQENNLNVESNHSLSESISQTQKLVSALFSSLEYIIIILAFLAMTFSIMITALDRVHYYRLLRVLGASRIFIYSLMFAKYACIWALAMLFVNFTYSVLVMNIQSYIPLKELGIVLSNTLPLTRSLIISFCLPFAALVPTIYKLQVTQLSRD